MKILIDSITEEVTKAFVDNGYDAKYGKVTLSNRPDLCEYQCNGAMAAAKEYKCAPFMISDKIAEALTENIHLKNVFEPNVENVAFYRKQYEKKTHLVKDKMKEAFCILKELR